MNIKEIESEVGGSSYAQVAERLKSLSDDDLFLLLDSESTRIGDTAADLLAEREKFDDVIDAILCSRIRTAKGRLRASNVLLPFGKMILKAEVAYLYLLGDKSPSVVSNALFGLVFWQNKKNISAIEAAKCRSKSGGKIFGYCEKAIEALKRGDPFYYSPNFADPNNVWELGIRRRNDHE